MGHATLHFPPETESVPAQRKARLLLSISPIARADRLQQMETCTGIAERVVCVSVALPTLVRRPAFQVGIRAATASTSTCSSARLSLDSDKGAPRYLVGKSWSLQGNTSWTAWITSEEHRIGVIVHLSRLVDRPDARRTALGSVGRN